jgi:hypothetical protein
LLSVIVNSLEDKAPKGESDSAQASSNREIETISSVPSKIIGGWLCKMYLKHLKQK